MGAVEPAAALAASEALLGFGGQIGEDGWEAFWDQLQDPQGRWFVIAQVLMDFMHVKTSMSPHGEATDGAKAPRARGAPAGTQARAPDLDAARAQVAKARAVVQRVHDAATDGHEPGGSPHAADPDSSQRKQAPTSEEIASGDARSGLPAELARIRTPNPRAALAIEDRGGQIRVASPR